MKALSLTQPWATLVVIGAKHYETRSWATGHRGPLAIHASKGFPKDCQLLCYFPHFQECLELAGYTNPHDLPNGALVGLAYMTECLEAPLALADPKLSVHEPHFGDFERGRFAWKLKDPWKLEQPIACTGRLGLWNVPEELAADLLAQSRRAKFPSIGDQAHGF
jgi:hypothetical protein